MSKDDNIRNHVYEFGQRLADRAKDEYYATPEARIDTILGENQDIYRRLMKVKQEWDQRWKSGVHDMSFPEYLREVYGIEMTIQPEGVDLRYRILDEQKHTLFLLKFGA
jgi:hypothetical protein